MDKTSCSNKKLTLLSLFLFSSCFAEMPDPSIQFSRPLPPSLLSYGAQASCLSTEALCVGGSAYEVRVSKDAASKITPSLRAGLRSHLGVGEPASAGGQGERIITQDVAVVTEDVDDLEKVSFDLSASDSSDRYSKEKRSAFYDEYIAKYYPKAYVIQSKFLKMTVDQVAAALNDTVYVFVKEPWFYFQNTPKGFRLIYFWEYVIDQLWILHNFLINARVDKKTKKIFWPNNKSRYNFWSNFSSFSADKKSTLLADYLKEHFVNVYADFYALSFDYHVKMFNEGVLLKKVAQANRYMNEIEYILDKLKGTPQNADYTESANFCKEVLAILKKKMGYDNYVNSFKGGGATPEGTV